ncbi:MAG: hypothetical protein SGILL_003506 [Bacillariaceae sp.]
MTTAEGGSVSIPQAIAFKDKSAAAPQTPARPKRTPPKPDEDGSDLFSSSAATSSVSPLRSEPDSSGYNLDEVHILVKAIREQSQKQPKKTDPPAWTEHLSTKAGSRVEKAKKQQNVPSPREEKRDDGSKTNTTVDTKEDNMVAKDSKAPTVAAAEQDEMHAVAESAQKEIAALEDVLTKQEEDAEKLALKAQQMIAQLEAEAEQKAKAAEEALRKVKLALEVMDENAKKDMSAVKNMVESMARGDDAAEDRQAASPVPSAKEEREHSSVNDDEVAAITKEEHDIAEPPTIVRQTELPADPTSSKAKNLTVITKFSEDAHEFAVSPLNDGFDSPRKRASMNDDTMDTIFKKIEECQEMILNPDASMDEQSKAAELMEKMARIAKITESLEPQKTEAIHDMISPLSEINTADVSAATEGEHSIQDIQKKIEECRQALMDKNLSTSDHAEATAKMESLAKEALAAEHDLVAAKSQDEQEAQAEKWEAL